MTTAVIWVSNIDASVKFYQALFEDKHPYVTPEFASVSDANNEVLLHLLPEQYRGQPVAGEENPIKPVFTVKSLELAKLAAGRSGGSVQREVQEHESWRYADGKDVDGHVIQLRERI
jgi:predicted lactoylglutathione lyase